MTIQSDAVPRKTCQVSYHVLGLVPYFEQLAMVDRMVAVDPRVTYEVLTPVGDEVWNFIDGRKTVGEVLEAVCLEFDLAFDPGVLMPFMEGIRGANLITFEAQQPDGDRSGPPKPLIDI